VIDVGLDVAAPEQSIELEGGRTLELGSLLDVLPIDFRQDGRWELVIRAAAAELCTLH
jgi:hypothetical protein